MADREKVISDLEEQIAWIRDNDFHKFPGWGHAVLAMRDALALLKEQEPVEPKAIDTSNSKLYHSDMFKNYYCGKCGEFLHVVNRKDLFCSQCGRAVKWG